MKRFLQTGIFCVLFLFVTLSPVNAATPDTLQGSGSSTVTAKIPGHYLTLCGLASPYASLVVTAHDTLLRSSIAEPSGNFYVSEILINNQLTEVCISAVDFKRIGESSACLAITPSNQDITICDIFLPPTIGISEKEIDQGGTTQIYGYTMPGATVRIRINNNEVITVTADSTGYYSFTFKGSKPGTYTFIADATLNNKKSLEPKKSVTLTVLSLPEKVQRVTQQQVEKALEIFDSGVGLALIILVLITIIITILIKLNPRFMRIIVAHLPKRHSKLHHDWLLEFLKKHPLTETQTLRIIEGSK